MDSTTAVTELTHAYPQNTDQTAAFTLNGNTFDTVRLDGTALTADTDYTADNTTGQLTLKSAWLNTLPAGEYTLTVDFWPLGEDPGSDSDRPSTVSIKLTVEPLSLEGATVAVRSGETFTYTGASVIPAPEQLVVTKDGTVVDPAQYTVTASNNIQAGTADLVVTAKTGGSCTGSASGTFTIQAKSLGGGTTIPAEGIAVEEIGNVTYNAAPHTPEPAVTITGQGNYTGSVRKEFTIDPKPVTVRLAIADKPYDGLTNGQYDIMPDLSGIESADRDAVSLLPLVLPTASFESAAVGENIPVRLSEEFLLGGDRAFNYELSQPENVSASIYNVYDAAEDIDYRLTERNPSGWTNEDFVIRAGDGKLVSLNNTDEGPWSDELTWSGETGEGEVTFYVRSASTRIISLAETVTYKLDRTAPTGEVGLLGGAWETNAAPVSFERWFNTEQTLQVLAKDELSGLLKVETLEADHELTADELNGAAWTALESLTEETDGAKSGLRVISPEEGKKFVVYVRLTDAAGNVTELRVVTTEIPPVPDDNDFTTCPKCGYHDWVETAEGYRCVHCGHVTAEKPKANVELNGSYRPGQASASGRTNPQTGDESRPALCAALALGSALGLLAVARKRREE